MSRAATESDTAPNRWDQIAERGSLWGIRFGVRCYRVLGRWPFAVVLHGVVAYLYLTDRRGRRASRAYLQRLWSSPEGRASLSRRPGPWQSFLHYRALALVVVDRVALWSGRGDGFEFEVHGGEHVERLARERRGAIVVGAHLGSFDALRLLAERQRTTVNALMFTAHAQRINAVFRELSPSAEARVIQVDPGSVQAVFEIRERVRRGELVAILADRVEPGERRRTSRVPFLGENVELPQAPFLLAGVLDCPVLLMLALRRDAGRYEVFTELLAERVCLPRREREKAVEELLTAYAARLEHYCQRAPTQWFNFYDYWGDETSSAP
jgi:predicted LPLAT superfamily acyltransferase